MAPVVSTSEISRWRAVARVLRSPMDAISCVLLPCSCSLCGSPQPRLSSVPICNACWMEIPVQSGSACSRCGDSLDQPLMGLSNSCRTCRIAPPPFERAVSYGPYTGRMRQAIHALKYERIHPVAHRLGLMLGQAIAQLATQAPSDLLVVPVPLHGSKHRDRGFNQARLLADAAIAALRKSHPAWRLKPAPGALVRHRLTGSQAGLTPRQRRINVRGAFRVSNPDRIAGKHILIVDDILTTGATVRAAARALVSAGAESVWVATLARAARINPIGSGAVELPGGGSKQQPASTYQPSF
jgi:ComF family protein